MPSNSTKLVVLVLEFKPGPFRFLHPPPQRCRGRIGRHRVFHLGKEYLNLILVSTQGIPALVELVPEEPNGIKLPGIRHTEVKLLRWWHETLAHPQTHL